MSVTAVVDFGSSHTVTAVHVPGDAPRVVTVDGEPWLPSAVFLSRDDTLVVGPDAVRMAASDPGRLESRAKARIAEREVLLGDTVVPVVTIVRAVLTRAVRAASAVARTPVDHLVLTHPAGWSTPRLDGLLSAAQGLAPRISTIVEPVGAGAWFATRGQVGVDGAERLPLGAVLAVLDIGGATTDVAVVRREASGIAVVGRSSIADLGGGDFDQRIVDHLRRTVPGVADRLIDAGAEERVSLVRLRELVAFRRAVRRGKELLSRHERVELVLPDGLPAVTLTRADLETVLAPDLDRITAFTLRTILLAGVEAAELTAVQLVGGSTRIPLLRRLLGEVIPAPVHIDDQPEAVVALGACAVAVSHAETAVEPRAPEGPPPVAAPPARNRVVALVIVMVVAIAAVGYGFLRPADVVGGGAAAASERFTLPRPAAGKEVVSAGTPSDGLVSGLVGSPVRMFDGVTDIDWTVNGVLDPATDQLIAAGAPKPPAGERWVLVDASTRARDAVNAPFYLADTYLVDDRGLMIAPAKDTPMPVTCPTQAPAALFAGQVARQCLAFAVSVLTPVRAVVISTVSSGRQVGVTVPVDGPAPAVPVAGTALPLGVVRPLRVGVLAAVIDVVTTPSAYVAPSVVDRPGSRAVVVRAVAEADGEVSVADLAARLVLRDDRRQAVPARLTSDRNGCAVGTVSGRFVVCAVFVVPAGLPLGSVAWNGDATRPFVWQLP